MPRQSLLTPREREVLSELLSDRSEKQIAGNLGLSVRTTPCVGVGYLAGFTRGVAIDTGLTAVGPPGTHPHMVARNTRDRAQGALGASVTHARSTLHPGLGGGGIGNQDLRGLGYAEQVARLSPPPAAAPVQLKKKKKKDKLKKGRDLSDAKAGTREAHADYQELMDQDEASRGSDIHDLLDNYRAGGTRLFYQLVMRIGGDNAQLRTDGALRMKIRHAGFNTAQSRYLLAALDEGEPPLEERIRLAVRRGMGSMAAGPRAERWEKGSSTG